MITSTLKTVLFGSLLGLGSVIVAPTMAQANPCGGLGWNPDLAGDCVQDSIDLQNRYKQLGRQQVERDPGLCDRVNINDWNRNGIAAFCVNRSIGSGPFKSNRRSRRVRRDYRPVYNQPTYGHQPSYQAPLQCDKIVGDRCLQIRH